VTAVDAPEADVPAAAERLEDVAAVVDAAETAVAVDSDGKDNAEVRSIHAEHGTQMESTGWLKQ